LNSHRNCLEGSILRERRCGLHWWCCWCGLHCGWCWYRSCWCGLHLWVTRKEKKLRIFLLVSFSDFLANFVREPEANLDPSQKFTFKRVFSAVPCLLWNSPRLWKEFGIWQESCG
jgi:hypothetical protein